MYDQIAGTMAKGCKKCAWHVRDALKGNAGYCSDDVFCRGCGRRTTLFRVKSDDYCQDCGAKQFYYYRACPKYPWFGRYFTSFRSTKHSCGYSMKVPEGFKMALARREYKKGGSWTT